MRRFSTVRFLLVLFAVSSITGCGSSNTAVMPEKVTEKPGPGGLKSQGATGTESSGTNSAAGGNAKALQGGATELPPVSFE
ncbi:MAG: hypothetical protein EHM42_00560 [Planctomycetaceae bacterium]|nr:MAG: hypothetical protein EHM42_15390 [Planctomycetaceae bacterium]RPI90960.1 MAG: hypothetical protein EHM42_00560 [Planctomycetaceae bacterium]